MSRVICDQHRLYQAGCPGCKQRNRDYQRYRRKQVAYGRWHPGGRYVSAHPARVHIDALWLDGLSYRAIATKAEVSTWTIRNIVTGEATEIGREISERILAITTGVDTRPSKLIPKVGTMRRLQALCCNGWPQWVVITQALGWKRGSTMSGRQQQLVTVHVHEKIKKFYDEHWDKPGPSEATRRNAARLGWIPAQCWDDETIDDITAQPQGLPWTHPKHPRHVEMSKRRRKGDLKGDDRDVA